MGSKRQRTNEDSDHEFDNDHWPRFLVIESADNDNPLSKLSPFAINKGIEGMAGKPQKIRKMGSAFLVEVAKKSHSDNLLSTTALANVPVKVSAHRSMNSCKGVIRCRELEGLSDESITEDLSLNESLM